MLTLHSVSIYQGVLLAEMLETTQFKIKPLDIDDVVAMLDSNKVRINLQDRTSIVAERYLFNHRNDSDSTAFKDALRTNPPLFLDKETRFDEANRTVLNVYVSKLELLQGVYVGYCDYLMMPMDTELTYSMAIPLAANISERLLSEINTAILENLDTIYGMRSEYYAAATSIYDNCQKDLFSYMRKKPGSSLTLTRMQGAFLLPLLGCMVGVIAILAEAWHSLNN